jgi:hypothetical protein
MLTAQIEDIVADIKYKDWEFTTETDQFGDSLFLRVAFDADGKRQYGRKWLISRHMPKSEIVLTALKAVITAEEHEAREAFRYQGVRIFGPHIDVDKLVELARYKDNLDLREEAEAAL